MPPYSFCREHLIRLMEPMPPGPTPVGHWGSYWRVHVSPATTGLSFVRGRSFRLQRSMAFSWHCLIHTFVSKLVMGGVDIRTTQALMGHRCILVTVLYSHLAPQHTLAAVELLARAVPASPHDTTTDTSPFVAIQPEPAYVQ